jgi:hypothetical protein
MGESIESLFGKWAREWELDAKARRAGMGRVVKQAIRDGLLRPHAFVGRSSHRPRLPIA